MLESAGNGHVDQAAGLRRLFRPRTGRAIAFVSGREACGRTRLLVQTAAALAQAGESVLLIDENGGDDNVYAAFKLRPGGDLLDVALRGLAADTLIQPAAAGLGVLSAARFAVRGGALDGEAVVRLDAGLRRLQETHSYVLIDCAGRSGQPLSPMALLAPGLAVVVAAQSSAITRAYALIKRLARESGRRSFEVVITRARGEQEAQAIFRNLQQTAQDHLGVKLDYLAGAPQPATDNIAGSLGARLHHGATAFRSLRHVGGTHSAMSC